MSDDAKCYATTPAATLEQHITDSNVAKNEAEWWAYHEITRLREELDAAKRAAAVYEAWKFPEDIQELTVANERLREENARVIRENKVSFEAVGGVVKANDKLKEENARLREAVGLMTTMAPFMELDVNDPVGTAKTVWAEQEKLFQENARLRAALKPFVPKTQVIDAAIPDTRPIDVMVRAGELRAAAAAIREGGKDE